MCHPNVHSQSVNLVTQFFACILVREACARSLARVRVHAQPELRPSTAVCFFGSLIFRSDKACSTHDMTIIIQNEIEIMEEKIQDKKKKFKEIRNEENTVPAEKKKKQRPIARQAHNCKTCTIMQCIRSILRLLPTTVVCNTSHMSRTFFVDLCHIHCCIYTKIRMYNVHTTEYNTFSYYYQLII